ncbi:MAG: hypothetical protein RSC01_10610, partial [Oscillospiraceae bacterium]
HFRCIDLIIDHASDTLNEKLIELLHFTLKSGTGDYRKDWVAVGTLCTLLLLCYNLIFEIKSSYNPYNAP